MNVDDPTVCEGGRPARPVVFPENGVCVVGAVHSDNGSRCRCRQTTSRLTPEAHAQFEEFKQWLRAGGRDYFGMRYDEWRKHKQPPLPDDVPRRIRMDQWTPAERAIYDAVQAVEAAGAHPLLTDAVILLGQAREKVADYVDGIPS